MLVPDKLRTAAIELLERVRVTLDIPSRAEVIELADRIESIGQKIDQLELHRQEDVKRVVELQTKQVQAEKVARKPRVKKASAPKAKDAKPASKKKALKKAPKAKATKSPRKPQSKATRDSDL